MNFKEDPIWWFRNLDMWEWEIFNPRRSDSDWFAYGLSTVLVLVACFFIGMPLAIEAHAAFAALLAVPPVWAIGAFNAGKLDPIYQLRVNRATERYNYRSDDPYGHRAIYRAGVNYCLSSKDDRKNYHQNILDIIQDPDLTVSQRKTLAEEMDKVDAAISARNKAKRIHAKREVSIEHVVAQLEDAKVGIETETQTYKELT